MDKPPDKVKSYASASQSGSSKGQQQGKRVVYEKPIVRQPKFEGRCDDLKGFVYDCSDTRQTDMFVKTTKELAEYVGRKFKTYPSDAKKSIDDLKKITIAVPVAPVPTGDATTVTDAFILKRYKKQIDAYFDKVAALSENVKRIYSVVWGQCTDALRARLEGTKGYKEVYDDQDGIELLLMIKGIVYNFQSQKYLPQAIHEAKRRFYMLQQGRHTTTIQYLEQFQNTLDVLKHCGGTIGDDPGLGKFIIEGKGMDPLSATDAEMANAQAIGQESYIAMAFIMGSDRVRFGKLLENMENDFIQGRATFPTTLTTAYNLLINWKQDPRNMMRVVGQVNDGVSFANVNDDDGDATTLAQGNVDNRPPLSEIQCYKCQKFGHYANKCRNEFVPRSSATSNANVGTPENVTTDNATVNSTLTDRTGTTMLMNAVQQGKYDDTEVKGFLFHQHSEVNADYSNVVCKIGIDGKVSSSWILLDSQSTVDVFYNPHLLTNIRKNETAINIYCNAGVTTVDEVGDFENYGTVWYNPKGIANILSLAKVKSKFRVTYDSASDNAFTLHKDDGSTRLFNESPTGLYYLDASKSKHATTLVNVSGTDDHALVTTVDDMKKQYSSRDYSRAVLARNVQKMIGRPSTKQFIEIIDSKQLANCPVTRDDVLAAENIFGPDVGTLKGKTVRRAPLPVEVNKVNIPVSLVSRYKNVTLCADVMFVNKIPFMVTVSRHLKFGTATKLGNQQAKSLFSAIVQVYKVYKTRGFNIDTVLMDGQFEVLRGDMADLGMSLNVTSNNEHVPEIERYIRTVKERTRCIYNTLPFKKFPSRMTIEMVYAAVFWLNSFVSSGGVSDVYSPRTIITGQVLDYAKHCRLEFGDYVQVHEDHNNSMAMRTTGAIALRPTGNAQGGFYFFSLSTGRRLNRYRWTKLPMPGEVIDRVHQLAERNNADNKITFSDRDGDDISVGSDDDSTFDDDDNDFDEDERFIAGMDDVIVIDDDSVHVDGRDPNDVAPFFPLPNNDVPNVQYNDNDNNVAMDDVAADDDEEEEVAVNNDAVPDDEDVEVAAIEPMAADVEGEMNARYGERTGRYELRPRRPVDYSHRHPVLVETVLTQYGMKKGLLKYGEAGVAAVLSELKQLHDRGVLKPTDGTTLSPEERKASLPYLMFVKQKRCGKIKARGCADGRKQRDYTNKEDASSPTVAIESIMILCAIDAKEGRDVATVDIPGALLIVITVLTR